MKVLVMQPERSQHGDEEQFESYALGNLPEAQASQLEEHLLTCAACRDQLAKVEGYVLSVRQAGKQLIAEDPAPQPVRFAWRLPPILAAAAIVVLAVVSWQTVSKNGAPPLAVRLMTTRGAGGTAQAPAGRALQLQPDLEGLVISDADRLEIAGPTGTIVWTGALHTATLVPGMRPGLFFVRVRRHSGALLREYALEIKTP